MDGYFGHCHANKSPISNTEMFSNMELDWYGRTLQTNRLIWVVANEWGYKRLTSKEIKYECLWIKERQSPNLIDFLAQEMGCWLAENSFIVSTDKRRRIQ